MSNIRVRIRNPEAIRARLRPVQSIRVGTTDTYLFDPDLILDSVEDARDWAIKTDGLVDLEDYSSKAWAIGGTGTETNNSKYWAEQSATSASNAATSETNASNYATSASNSALLSKDWATKTDGTVDGVDYSSKYYAQQITPIASDITTVAGISPDVTTVAGISSDVTSVSSNATNINKVASDINRVDLVADDISSVHTVAVDISNVIDVASNQTNIDAVAGDLTNIDLVAGDLTNIDNASTYATNAHTWAEGTDAQVQALGGIHSAKGWADTIGNVYKPAGSVAFASLPTLDADHLGFVYNVTDSFTTTSDFVEGAGKDYPAGTNVVCIDTGSSVYKWDILGGFVDLSGYQAKLTTGTGIDITSNVISVTSPALINTATYPTDSIALITASTNSAHNAVAVGYNSAVRDYAGVAVGTHARSHNNGTAIGGSSEATGSKTVAIGYGAKAESSYSIQIGQGTNTEANSFYVGTSSSDNWKMLDSSGLIPDARISTNIARTSAIPSAYGAGLSYSSSSLQLLDQNGNNLGSAVTIKSTPDLDGVTIDTNSDDELEAIGVIDNNGNAIKTWTGTLAQYNAIVTKDSNTLYNITDDVSITQTILEALYPVGSLYIGKMSTCPLASLISGSTWTLVASDKVLQGSGTYTAGTSVSAGLPNITGYRGNDIYQTSGDNNGALYVEGTVSANWLSGLSTVQTSTSFAWRRLGFDASRSNSIYGNSTTVQPPAYVVNIWERTA